MKLKKMSIVDQNRVVEALDSHGGRYDTQVLMNDIPEARYLFEIRIESKIIRIILRCSSESVRSIMTNSITVRRSLTAKSRKIVSAFAPFRQETSVQYEHDYL